MPNRVDGQVARPETARPTEALRPEAPRAGPDAEQTAVPPTNEAGADRVEISAAARQAQTTRPEPERGGAAETPSAQPDDAPAQGPTADRASQLREQQEQSRAANTESEPGETGNLVDVTGG